MSDDDIEIDFNKIKNVFKKKNSDSKEKVEERVEMHENTPKETEKKDTTPTEASPIPEKPKEEPKPEQKKEEIKTEPVEKPQEDRIKFVQDKEDEEEDIDFSKVTNLFKRKKQDKPVQKSTPDSTDDEEFNLNLGGIKTFAQKIIKKSDGPKGEDEVDINFEGALTFFKKYNKVILISAFIIIAMFLSINVRMQNYNVAIAEDVWAPNSIYQAIQQDIGSAVASQYPDLPQDTRNAIINEQLVEAQQSGTYTFKTGPNSGAAINIDDQIKQTADFFRTSFQDPDGNMYMPDIDPYYWLRYVDNIVELGHIGDEVIDGAQWDNHMLAPVGREIPDSDRFHPNFLALFYKINPFIDNTRSAVMYYPVYISALTVLFVFLIGRRIAGNVGGFFAASMAAINAAFVNRTLFGHGDTDALVVFFSVLVMWFFIESIATKKIRNILLYGLGAGFFTGMYSSAWGGWWFLFDFMLVGLVAYIIFALTIHRGVIKDHKANPIGYLKLPEIKLSLIAGATYVITSGIFTSIFTSFTTFIQAPLTPIGFTTIKSPVLPSLWPNVLTTVAELNPGSIQQIIGSVGGIFLFFIALIGIALTLVRVKKPGMEDVTFVIVSAIWWFFWLYLAFPSNQFLFFAILVLPYPLWVLWKIYRNHTDINVIYAALLSVWFIGTIYGSTQGIRFTLLLAPAFSIAFGAALGLTHKYTANWLSKEIKLDKMIVSIVLFALLGGLFFFPQDVSANAYAAAGADVPIINDAWYNSLKSIEQDSNEDAIISSWWDFGHHFKQISDRAVTFDGTTQATPQAHWIGRFFIEENETIAVGILRMLNCGGNSAYESMDREIQDSIKTKLLVEEMFKTDRSGAIAILEREGLSTDIIEYTHCEAPDSYVIASDDMIGKSGVWAHFGSWDFRKAAIWRDVRRMNDIEGLDYIKNLGYSDEEAQSLLTQVRGINNDAEANSWVSPWPSYQSQPAGCTLDTDAMIRCGNGVQVNSTTMEATIPTDQGTFYPVSFVYTTKDGHNVKHYNNNTIPQGVSVILLPSGNGYQSILAHPQVAGGMFTRMFFMNGHGLEHFSKLTEQSSITNNRIIVWKANWEGGEENFATQYVVNSGENVQLNYIGYFENGTVFDTTIQAENVRPNFEFDDYNTSSAIFPVGVGQLVPGFDQGLIGMRVGEEKIIEVTPELGYQQGPLANKTLFFKVRVERA